MANENAYIIEFITMGRALKVTAVDPETGLEVSIVGDPKASRQSLSRVAVAKLTYVLKKRECTSNKDKGPGVLV